MSFAKAEQPMSLVTESTGAHNPSVLTGSQPCIKVLLPSYFPWPENSFLLLHISWKTTWLVTAGRRAASRQQPKHEADSSLLLHQPAPKHHRKFKQGFPTHLPAAGKAAHRTALLTDHMEKNTDAYAGSLGLLLIILP